MHHPDFRVAGKIFASLGVPDKNWGMVKLTPEQQKEASSYFDSNLSPALMPLVQAECSGLRPEIVAYLADTLTRFDPSSLLKSDL